jgi:hypothetical protein
MKNRVAILVLLSATALFPACTMWREHAVSNWADATGGEGLERTFWKEVKAEKWNQLQAHLANNYVSITPEEGHMDRAGALAHLQQLQLDDYTIDDLQTELNGETVVVTYAITLRGKFAGQSLPSAAVRMMTVWQRQKAGWMAIAHSVMGSDKKADNR